MIDKPHEKKQVLLMDHNPGDGRLVRELLGDLPEMPYVLETADSLAAGLSCLESRRFDVILTGFALPDCPGLSAVEKVCASSNGVPVVALSGREDADLLAQALRAGARDCLRKDELTSALLDRSLCLAAARARFEQKVKNSGRQFINFIENFIDGIVCVDASGAVRFFNRAALGILGCGEEDLNAKPFGFAIAQEGVSEIDAGGNGTLRKTVEVRVVRIDWDGELVSLVMLRDVSGRKHSELEQQRLKAVIELAREAIVITDPEGKIEYVNPGFELVTGYGASEAIGQTPSILKSGRQDEAFYKALWETITRGEVWQGRFVNKRKDGTLYEEEATISPVLDGRGAIINFFAVKRDVTEVVEMQRRLSQAERLESIGQLAGGIAHDFNNVLQAIMGYAQLAQHEGLSDEQCGSEIEDILKAADRAAVLTRQLLAFSRRQTLQPVNLNIGQVIESLMKMLRRVIGENIVMEIKGDPALAAVCADPGQVEQVIMNLCVNSRDAMPEGGRIVIETGNAVVDKDYCRTHPSAREGRYVRLSIADTGQGIPPEIREHIFEPFFTTKGEGRGTGLGLATVYGIVKQHGGFIDMQSLTGRGTKFTIHLPAVDANPARPDKAAPQDASGGSETILFADDEAPIRKVSRRLLERAGYRVLTAASGLEAVKVFKEHKDRVDLVVLDVIMPELSSVEACGRISLLKPGVPILFTSGYSSDVTDIETLLKRGGQLLQKPYRGKELLEKVRRVLERAQQAARNRITREKEHAGG